VGPAHVALFEHGARKPGWRVRWLAHALAVLVSPAFAPDSEASLWVRVQCARLLAEVAERFPRRYRRRLPRLRGPVTGVNRIDGMPPGAAAESFAVQRRRESRRQEWTERAKFTEMPDKHLDPVDMFWTSLENKPLSRLSGIFQKRRGVRSGLPDVLVLYRGKPIFVEFEVARWRGDESAETGPCRTAAGRCYVVDGAKRTRCADGAAPLRRDLPPSMEAAEVATVGGTVRGPDAAAATSARRGGASTSGTTAVAIASACP
jgi:hypothetical protein